MNEESRHLIPLSGMAAVLGIAPGELRLAAEAGEIPCVRLGRKTLLFDAELTTELLRKRLGALKPAGARERADGR